ncbi:MAG: hypothetical protein AAF664_04545 [Planctomycetota bacterium]
MNTDTPRALFITWATYGTFLPGDSRGWRHRMHGQLPESHQLRDWHLSRLTHEPAIMTNEMQKAADVAAQYLCKRRNWVSHAFAARSNHVHFVVSAAHHEPALVRDQVKAEILKQLRKQYLFSRDRPLWAANGDIEFLDSESEVFAAATYVRDAQDRKDRDR